MNSIGQTSSNLEKYWNYRARLLGTDGGVPFVFVGDQPGMSLPASARNSSIDCATDWDLGNNKCPSPTGKGKMSWGDGTIHLSNYLGVLALEYANLKAAGKSPNATLKELSFALDALERLDLSAEVVLGYEQNKNGFFLRDDVPAEFLSSRQASSSVDLPDCLKSDYSCKAQRGSIDVGAYTSQDQIIALLFGLSFVSKLVHDGPTGNSLSKRAQNLSYTMVKGAHESKWRIKGPGNQKVGNRWGGDLRAFNSLMVDAVCTMTQKSKKQLFSKRRSFFIGGIARGTYNWGFGFQAKRNHPMIFSLYAITGKWSQKRMISRSTKNDILLYALAHCILHDGNVELLDFSRIKELIDLAPTDGTCFKSPDCEAPAGWRSVDRWWHPTHQDGNKYGIHMEWNGLDFMLLYNMYHYLQRDALPNYSLID